MSEKCITKNSIDLLYVSAKIQINANNLKLFLTLFKQRSTEYS